MDKILRINMGAKGGPETKVDPMGEYKGMGGRGLTSAIVSKEVPPLCHPLSEDNKLVIAPGLLSGTTAANSGRISIGFKGPLTGTIKEANAGGQASQVLAKLGYAAVVLEGVPEDDRLYKIFINKDGVITPAKPEDDIIAWIRSEEGARKLMELEVDNKDEYERLWKLYDKTLETN